MDYWNVIILFVGVFIGIVWANVRHRSNVAVFMVALSDLDDETFLTVSDLAEKHL